jgi:Lsr2
MREALARYVNAARRVGGSARRPARGGSRPANGLNTTEVREWARAQGIEGERPRPGAR